MAVERYDTLIIGAGMSGLAAGIRLAQYDRPVVILERHYLWGGLNSFYKRAGRRIDVGMHALTNYVPPKTTGTPLAKILRQLRLRHEDLKLGEQHHSEILFPGERLTFTNDFGHLEAEVARAFPRAADAFRHLAAEIRAYDLRSEDFTSARAVLADRLPEPQLIEMVLLPLLYYGSPRADDLDWHSFCVLFRSIFLEGLARPAGGIKSLLDILVKRYRSLGGELRMKTGVARILVEGGVARGVVLDDGAELRGERILSSAGWTETMKLCGKEVPLADVGRISFVESISVLDEFPAALGHTAATSFFCREDRCRYEEPEGPIDARSGVISAPSNFATELPLEEGLMRLTVMARHDRWVGLPQDEYARQKERCAEEAIASAVTFVPDWRPHTVFRDIFTPRTIEHYTGHVHGAVYGSPRKHLDGETGIANLYLCGTDQGYLGVIGAMISGISMANRHALVPPRLTMSK